mmetsp:Transcript_34018/g.30801  ORF Transcript_34018/g.30801 Transcript_34018/m.30801 type:complete len:82 (-) Transcript_34018:149-394(-)
MLESEASALKKELKLLENKVAQAEKELAELKGGSKVGSKPTKSAAEIRYNELLNKLNDSLKLEGKIEYLEEENEKLRQQIT